MSHRGRPLSSTQDTPVVNIRVRDKNIWLRAREYALSHVIPLADVVEMALAQMLDPRRTDDRA